MTTRFIVDPRLPRGARFIRENAGAVTLTTDRKLTLCARWPQIVMMSSSDLAIGRRIFANVSEVNGYHSVWSSL